MPDRKSSPSPQISGSTLDGILEELCDRKQAVLLATPYFAIEARLMERRGSALMLRAPMSAEAVRQAVGTQPLRIRFPWDLTMFAGPMELQGAAPDDTHRTILVSMPDHLSMDERRAAWRCEQVGRSRGAIGGQRIVRVNVENLSPLGVCVFCTDAISSDEFYTGKLVNVELTVDRGPQFSVKARICHSEGQTLGLAFQNLDPGLQDELRAWSAPRKKEAQRAWDNRTATRAAAEAALKPKSPPKGIFLITSDTTLIEQVTSMLEEDLVLRTCAPALAPLKRMLEDPAELVLLDITGASLDTRHRLKAMMDALNLPSPVVVIGNGVSPETMRNFSAEIKAAWTWDWNPNQGPFFQRLIKGIIRRHWKPPEA